MTLDVTLGAAFLAGLLSFFSPCILPLVPPFLCYMAGISVEDLAADGSNPRPRVLMSALCFVAGFSVVFVGLGLSAAIRAMFARSCGALCATSASCLSRSMLARRAVLARREEAQPREAAQRNPAAGDARMYSTKSVARQSSFRGKLRSGRGQFVLRQRMSPCVWYIGLAASASTCSRASNDRADLVSGSVLQNGRIL